MDNRANKRNTFRPGNLLIASAALLLMMVSMGYTFPFVNQDQKSGISVNNVNWFSTDVGIVSFDGNEHIPNHQLKGVAFVENPEGPELWIASPVGATVVRLPINDQTEAITFNPENVNILSNDVACIASGNDSIRWIRTDKGVSAVSNDKWLTPDYEMHYPSMLFSMFPITSMVTNLTGDSLYVGTAGAGVARHSGIDPLDNWTVFTTDDGLVNDFGQVISDDKKGNLWIGTDTGITSYANRKFNNY